MNRRLSFHPLAEQELNEAANYYDAASPGLGATFLNEVEHAIKQILEHRKAASLVNRVVRRKLVRRFPYSVMYSVQTDTIRILAIANQKRRPFYWRGRK
jgi:plasmid stabilization system protein ParE